MKPTAAAVCRTSAPLPSGRCRTTLAVQSKGTCTGHSLSHLGQRARCKQAVTAWEAQRAAEAQRAREVTRPAAPRILLALPGPDTQTAFVPMPPHGCSPARRSHPQQAA